MKYALAVNKVADDIGKNIETILEYIYEAKENEADMIIFPECCITGLIKNDIPEHDLALGLNEKSSVIQCICECATRNGIYVSISFLEVDGGALYDSAICIDHRGMIISKYRRISDGWHGPHADKSIYRLGSSIQTFSIDKSTYSYLICGDLFDDDLVAEIKSKDVDILIFPYARTFADGIVSQDRWDAEEMPYYIKQIIKSGVTCLMTNYINDSVDVRNYFFGGAFAVDRSGHIIAQKAIGEAGILYVTI